MSVMSFWGELIGVGSGRAEVVSCRRSMLFRQLFFLPFRDFNLTCIFFFSPRPHFLFGKISPFSKSFLPLDYFSPENLLQDESSTKSLPANKTTKKPISCSESSFSEKFVYFAFRKDLRLGDEAVMKKIG